MRDMSKDFLSKATWVARKDYMVASDRIRLGTESRLGYYVFVGNCWITVSQAKKLIKEIEQHVKRIEDFKAKRK